MTDLAAFVSGLVFAAGLALSGMTRPSKIIAFLDFTGAGGKWDPSLLLVMGAAVAVSFVANQIARRQKAPLAASAFSTLPSLRIDGRLLTGSALFGIGWGASGFCPGPAVVAAAALMPASLLFVPAMLGGMAVYALCESRLGWVALDDAGNPAAPPACG